VSDGRTRRTFLVRGGAALAAAAGAIAAPASAVASPARRGASMLTRRSRRAYELRVRAARAQLGGPPARLVTNGDEARYATKLGTYTKGLPHDRLGNVSPVAYRSLMRALESGRPEDFDRIRLGGVRPLTNPQGGLAFLLQGADSQGLSLPPPPAFASAEQAAEAVEVYWMALARDVPFLEYDRHPITVAAAAELSRLTDFRGPRSGARVTAGTLFRADLPGVLAGPYVSQFMWKDAPFGAERVARRIRTAVPGVDYMTAYSDWLAAQNGAELIEQRFDRTQRYVRNGRDLAEWVHEDVPLQPYLNALLVLIDGDTPLDPNHPYNHLAVHRGRIAGRYWRNQAGFATFGVPHISGLLGAVSKAALTIVWYHKWLVHRRLRPEEFGGRVHNHATGRASLPVHRQLLDAEVLDRVFRRHGTYLLPQAYPEGAPTHPAYGAGHATVAGACATVLKAFFDESFVLPGQVEASASGLGLGEYQGPYVRSPLTVGGELNKLAANIGMGRNFAGIHWRSDLAASLRLGEEVAIRFLQDERRAVNEAFRGFALTRFDGRQITI
jgi:hypothetical protein